MIDLTGQRFGFLLVVGPGVSDGRRHEAYWLCRCSCGSETSVPGSKLRFGGKRACGLNGHRYGDETRIRKAYLVHKVEYRTWAAMLSRCRNPRATGYSYYGGRGVKVCDEWLKFENFLSDMGPRPDGRFSIDRVDSDGDYTPKNCRWATLKQQGRNRRKKVFIEIDGKVRHLPEVAEEVGLPNSTIYNRVKNGWDPKRAISNPGVAKKDDGKCPKCGKMFALVGIAHNCL